MNVRGKKEMMSPMKQCKNAWGELIWIRTAQWPLTGSQLHCHSQAHRDSDKS